MNNVVEKFKKGNKIHIKESLKGSFTKWCGGNVTSECILRGKNSSNPKIRKKATFAANARKWKHLLGGNIVTPEMLKNHYQGEVTQGPTIKDKILDISNAVGQFVPFLGTALDTKERLAYAAAAGAIKDAAIPFFVKGASKTRLVERPGNSLNYARWRRGYGWVPAHAKARYTAPLGSLRGFGGFAKTLGLAGLILDTPNMVSDIENLKRVAGLPYNHQLIMKEKEGGSIEKLEKGSWIKNSLSFLNESGLGKTLVEGGLSFLLSSSQNKSIAGATDVAKAELDKEKLEASDYALLMATKKALEMLLIDPNNPNAFGGSIVLNYIRLQLYNEYLNSINLDVANRKALLDMLSLQMLSENTSGAISGIIQSGLGVVGNLLGGNTSSTNITKTSSSTKSVVLPKLTSNKWTPSTSLSNPVLGNNALGFMPNYTSLLNV